MTKPTVTGLVDHGEVTELVVPCDAWKWCDPGFLASLTSAVRDFRHLVDGLEADIRVQTAERPNVEIDEPFFKAIYVQHDLRLRHNAAIRIYAELLHRLCPHVVFGVVPLHHAGRENERDAEIRAWIEHSVKGLWATGAPHGPFVFADKASAALFKLFWSR